MLAGLARKKEDVLDLSRNTGENSKVTLFGEGRSGSRDFKRRHLGVVQATGPEKFPGGW